MTQLWWFLGGMVAILAVGVASRRLGRPAVTRAAVLEEVRRTLRDGVIERNGVGGALARGQLGALAVTVDVQRDARRPRQSPMWRVTAQGPVALDRPAEARVAGWEGWIDPWLQLAETFTVTSSAGPAFTVHAERPALDGHPLVAALRRQGERLGPGAIHARADLIRVETRCGARLEENRPLFAYLHVIGEIAELPATGPPRPAGPPIPRYGILPEGR